MKDKYENDSYAQGLINSVDIMIKWCETRIALSKSRITEPNSAAQIHCHARVKAYTEMLQTLQDRKKNIQKRNSETK